MWGGIPIYWDEQSRPFLPGIGRGQPLMGWGNFQPDGQEWRPLGPPRTLFKNAQDLTHPHWGSTVHPPHERPSAPTYQNGTLTNILENTGGPSPQTCSLSTVHSFWPVLLSGQSSVEKSHSSQQPLAIRGQIATASCSPGILDDQCEHSTVAMQTSHIWKWNHSMQVSQCTLPPPICKQFKTYWAEDLGLRFFDPQNTKLPVIPEIRMSLLFPVGLLVSGVFTVVLPLYRMLLEVSYH